MLTELLEKFEDRFKAIDPNEMAARIKQMDDGDLSEYIIDELIPNLRGDDYNVIISDHGAFDDEAVQEALETWLEEYLATLDRASLDYFVDTINSKIEVRKRKLR